MSTRTTTASTEPMRQPHYRITEPRGRDVAAMRAEYRAAIAAHRGGLR